MSNDLINQLREMNKKKNRQTPIVKYKPIEKPKSVTPEESKPANPFLSKIRKLSTISSPDDPEKIRIKEDYKKILENQLKAGNLVLKESVATINKVFLDIMKEDESYNVDEDLLQSEKRDRALQRVQRNSYHELTRDQLVRALSNDINEHFSRRYHVIDNLPLDKIEIIRKIKLTERDITYYTDEGEYIIDGRKAESFGGYLHLNRRFLTEYLDLDKISKAIKKGNKASPIAETKAWLMISPLVVPTGEGKVLLAPTDYIEQSLLEYVSSVNSREKRMKAWYEQIDYSKKQESELDAEAKHEPVKIVRDLMMFKEPSHSSLIYYPYNSMPDNGIELEIDIDFSEVTYIQTLNKLHYESLDFISWEYLKSTKENTEISDKIRKTFLKISGARDKINAVDIVPKQFGLLDENTKPGKDEDSEYNYTLNLDDSELETLIGKAVSSIDPEDDIEMEVAKKGKSKNRKIQSMREDIEDELEKIKKFKKNCKGCINTLYNFNLDCVSNVIRIIEESVFVEKDYTQELGRILSALNTLVNQEMYNQITEPLVEYGKKYPKDLQIDYAEVAEMSGEELEKRVEEELGSLIRSFKIRVNQALSEFGEFYDEYLEKVKEVDMVQSVIGKAIKIPWLSNLSLDINTGSIPLKLAPIMLNTLIEKIPELENEVKYIRKSADPIISNKLRSTEYEKMRSIVKTFGDRESVNWFEILKIVALIDSSLTKSYIKFYPDVRELLKIPQLREDMTRLNSLGKFIAANTEPTQQEMTFNQMFNELILTKKGLLCAIDYKGLAMYLVEEGDYYKGEEIVRYIPNPQLVDKYFPITESSKVYPKLEVASLSRELPNIPAIYLALHHILDSIKNNINPEEGLFVDNIDDIARYSELKYALEEKKLDLRFIDELNALYSKYDKNIKLLINLAKEQGIRVQNRHLKDIVNEFNETLENRKHSLDRRKDNYVQQLQDIDRMIDCFNNYHKEALNADQEAKILKEKHEIKMRSKREEILGEMKILKEKIDEAVGKELNTLIDKVEVFYNRDRAFKDLQLAWRYFGFDKFTKGRVLLNFLVTYVSDYSDMVQAAIFNIVRDFLMSCRDRETYLKQNNLSRAEVIRSMFEFVAFNFRLREPLRLNPADEIEISQIDAENQKMNKEDEEILIKFLRSLEDKTDTEIINAFKAFHRKDLIQDDLYIKVVYDDADELERIYPKWYNRDFTLPENIKIMLECGVPKSTLHPDHLADEKLMKIVETTEVDKELIARLKDYMV